LVILLLASLALLGSTRAVAAQEDDPFAENVVTATTTANLNLRDAPGASGLILTTLPAGTTVGFTGFTDPTGEWVQVDSENNPVGWVAASFLSNVPAGLQVPPEQAPNDAGEAGEVAEDVPDDVFSEAVVTATTIANLNLRDAPNGALLDTLPFGSVVGFTGFTDSTGDWVQVDAEEFPVGWVAAQFLSNVPAGLQVPGAESPNVEAEEVAEEVPEDVFSDAVVTATTIANLNLRDAPNGAVLATLPVGSVVGFTGFMDDTGDWVQVDAEGFPVGWVAAQFLSNVPDTLTAWDGDA
jgi:uncharacterized protein YraI